MNESLKLETLREAVAGTAAAFRCVTEYQSAGGPGQYKGHESGEGDGVATDIL